MKFWLIFKILFDGWYIVQLFQKFYDIWLVSKHLIMVVTYSRTGCKENDRYLNFIWYSKFYFISNTQSNWYKSFMIFSWYSEICLMFDIESHSLRRFNDTSLLFGDPLTIPQVQILWWFFINIQKCIWWWK